MGSGAAIGSVLGGRYHLVSVLGEGSMSTVYRAKREDGSSVAVKVLKKKIHNQQAATERLFREARVISRLDHPGCVRLLDWGVDAGRPFVVLELMEGEALNDAIRREKTFEPHRAVAVMGSVCDVLTAAHELGVVHRDLKPGNIMLLSTKRGVSVKVLDFGLARLTPKKQSPDETQPRELTRPGSTLGTPSYMAPEQVRGSRVDGRADIYAIGVILYELVSGVLPIIGETAIDTMLRQATDPPRPILEVAPDLDPRLAKAIMRCLEKKPEARYQSAADLKRALLEFDSPTSSPDATTTFVRSELPQEERTQLRQMVAPRMTAKRPLPKPQAPPPPPRRGRKPRVRGESETQLREALTETEADETRRHVRADLPGLPEKAGKPPLPLAIPKLPEVRVIEAEGESTKLHAPLQPDLSEMEVTIPAHDARPSPSGDDEHELERTIPVTSTERSVDKPTELHDMADWASTRELKRLRHEDVDLPDSTRPMRRGIEGPPPSRPSSRGAPSGPAPSSPAPSSPLPSSRAPSARTSAPMPVRPPERSFPPPPLRPQENSRAALSEVLSELPARERRWLIAAAIAGLALAVLLAMWLLL